MPSHCCGRTSPAALDGCPSSKKWCGLCCILLSRVLYGLDPPNYRSCLRSCTCTMWRMPNGPGRLVARQSIGRNCLSGFRRKQTIPRCSRERVGYACWLCTQSSHAGCAGHTRTGERRRQPRYCPLVADHLRNATRWTPPGPLSSLDENDLSSRRVRRQRRSWFDG